MSLPPQPGPWQSSQPSTTGSAQGQQPQGAPYGPPPPGYQQPWYPPPPPRPPKKGGGAKWVILGVVALAAIIAVSVAVTVVVLRSDSGGASKGATESTSGSAMGIASANDKGPVTIITEDPSCSPWTPIYNNLLAAEQNGWTQRDKSIPATSWSPEQRTQYEVVGRAIRNAADQTVALAKLTPHRVVRELYEQTIVYWRAYTDRIPSYTPPDDYLAGVGDNAASAVTSLCNAITYGSAAQFGPTVALAAPPAKFAPLGDPANPQRFLTGANPVCADLNSVLTQFDAATADWHKLDPNIPASQWTGEHKDVIAGVIPKMKVLADNLEQLGQRSGNPTFQDFAVFSAQYLRAYVHALENSYTSADNELANASVHSAATINNACPGV
jgi:hypothetical protein